MNIEKQIAEDIRVAKQNIQSEVMHVADVSRSAMHGEITITEYMAQLTNAQYTIQANMNRLADCAIWRDIT